MPRAGCQPSRLTTAVHSSATSASGTAVRRAGIAARTTTRLIALFTMTAASAANPNTREQQRQPELRTTQADQPAEQADGRARGEAG